MANYKSNPDTLKSEIIDYQRELNTLTRRERENMPLYEAWLEFCIHANQRELMRLNKAS